MIDESLIKRHSIGKDGFTWWLGQVCEAKTWEANYPELDVEKRLMDLDVDIHSSRSIYNVGDIVSTQHQNISKNRHITILFIFFSSTLSLFLSFTLYYMPNF